MVVEFGANTFTASQPNVAPSYTTVVLACCTKPVVASGERPFLSVKVNVIGVLVVPMMRAAQFVDVANRSFAVFVTVCFDDDAIVAPRPLGAEPSVLSENENTKTTAKAAAPTTTANPIRMSFIVDNYSLVMQFDL